MSEIAKGEALESVQPHVHGIQDSKDNASISTKLEHEKEKEKLEAEKAAEHVKPTDIAKSHGNKPSRGAEIDEQIENEERAELERKNKI